jgi:hypothetical protein
LKTKKSTTTSRVLEPASKTKIVHENDSLELKEHPVFVQGFFFNRTFDPILDLILQKKFLIGSSFTYLHP